MTEAEARAKAERICDEMQAEYGLQWMVDVNTGEPAERHTWVDKITAALLEAGKED